MKRSYGAILMVLIAAAWGVLLSYMLVVPLPTEIREPLCPAVLKAVEDQNLEVPEDGLPADLSILCAWAEEHPGNLYYKSSVTNNLRTMKIVFVGRFSGLDSPMVSEVDIHVPVFGGAVYPLKSFGPEAGVVVAVERADSVVAVFAALATVIAALSVLFIYAASSEG